MKLINKTSQDMSHIAPFAKDLCGFAQKRMGFNRPPTIYFDSDPENANNTLGKTAHYQPDKDIVTVYIDNRHPKDVLRSIAHELVHHTQNCRGEFDGAAPTDAGYAQEDGHMREMEREAYEVGNMCFRDWEDQRKKQLNETIYKRRVLQGDTKMSLKNWKNKELNSLLLEKFGYTPKEELEEDLGHDFIDSVTSNEKKLPEEKLEEDEDEEEVVEEVEPASVEQRLKNLDEVKLRQLIREKIKSALNKE
jgi:hypothetical protein